jgi:DNA-directed RNA polymerase subunit RPC12/RpoP
MSAAGSGIYTCAVCGQRNREAEPEQLDRVLVCAACGFVIERFAGEHGKSPADWKYKLSVASLALSVLVIGAFFHGYDEPSRPPSSSTSSTPAVLRLRWEDLEKSSMAKPAAAPASGDYRPLEPR